MESSQVGIKDLVNQDLRALKPFFDQIKFNVSDSVGAGSRERLDASPTTLDLVAAFLIFYGVLQLFEGVGLWLLKRWGEYFAVVATSLFIPLEVYELTEKITWLRVVALIVNVAAVVYLLVWKRLFGIRAATRRTSVRNGKRRCWRSRSRPGPSVNRPPVVRRPALRHDRTVARKPVRATVTRQRAVDLAAGARVSLARMRDPGLRLRRRQRRARWGVALRAVPTAVLGGLAAQAIVTGDPIAGACLAAVSAGGAWVTATASRHAWHLHQLPIPAARPVRPPRGSAARPAIDRLDADEVALRQLLGLLGEPASVHGCRRGRRRERAAAVCRRVVAIEAASARTSRAGRRSDPAVAALVTRLDAGVTAHGRLVLGGRRRGGSQLRGAGHLGAGAHRGRDRSPARAGARPDRA